MKIAFYGGQTAGIISLLTLLSQGFGVSLVFPEDNAVLKVTELYALKTRDKQLLQDSKFIKNLHSEVDLLICCHGRLKLPKALVTSVKCINLHPCLSTYPGANPIRRLIAENNPRASVASHWMVEKVDAGKIIIEEFKTISVRNMHEAEIYNQLYPLYIQVLTNTMRKIYL